MIRTIAFLLLCCLTSAAQIAGPDAPACNPKLAQMLVEQQVADSKTVTERPKRVRILLRSADFLWQLDQPTARGYFIDAFTVAKQHFAEKGFEKKNLRASASGSSTSTQVPDLRSDVIRAVAGKDPALARKFTEEVLADFEKAKDRKGLDQTREQDDLLRLAAESVATNPDFARTIFRRMMKYPVTQTWFWALNSSARADQSFTDAIYAEALQSFRNEKPSRLLYLSAYPFGAPTIFGRGRVSFAAAPIPGFEPNAALQRAFLETFFARVAAFSADPEQLNQAPDEYGQPEAISMVTAMTEIQGIVVERFPDLLEKSGMALAQANSALSAGMRKEIEDLDKSASTRSRNFEESIKDLEEADGKGTLTDFMIVQLLIQQKVRTEEHFAVYESWLGKIKDEKVRPDLTSYFWFLRSRLAIKEKRFAEAEKMAARVPELDHRAILLFEIAKVQMDDVNTSAFAFDTLNGVSKLTRSAPNSVAKAQILLSLVQLYGPINHSVALDELGEAVRVINQLEEPDLFQNWVFRQITGKEFGFMASISLPGNNMEGMFADLGKRDFEMSQANARSFDDKYFRTITVIAIAKNCLAVKPPPGQGRSR